MSWTIRGSLRARGQPSCNGIFCRMVCLPRSIIGGFSTVMGTINQYQSPNLQPQHPLLQQSSAVPEEWAFLASFEQQYDRGEGLQMAATLQPASFPFCAVIAPAAGNSIVVLQQMEGPIDPDELVEILQRIMEEKGSAFINARGREEEQRRAKVEEEQRIRTRAKEEEMLRADRQLREEQDVAYFAALQRDQEKERLRNARAQKPIEASNQQLGKSRQASSIKEAQFKESGA